MRLINILLTEYNDQGAKLLRLITRSDYTHVSLALEDDLDQYYSFNWKGFAIETIEKHRKRGVSRSACLQVEISEDAYECLVKQIDQFKIECSLWKYTKVGFLFALIGIPYKRDYHYFCSQFVASLLKNSNAIRLKRNENLYMPNHFLDELIYDHKLNNISYNIV